MKKVLIVEDNPVHIQSAKELLPAEFTAKFAVNFSEAIELLKSNNYDAVFTDMFIPYGNINSPINMSPDIDRRTPDTFGFAIAIYCANNDIPVVIQSDSNHHHSTSIAALETAIALGSVGDRKISKNIYVNHKIANGEFAGQQGKSWVFDWFVD